MDSAPNPSGNRAPHWMDLNGDCDTGATGERGYSVAYTRNTKPKLKALFKVPGLPSDITLKMRAKGSDSIETPEVTAQISGADVTFPVTESSNAWPNTVKFYDRSDDAKAFKLDWEIEVDGAWSKVDETKHQVYLTLADPETTLRQETLFYLSAKSADGKDTEDDVHDAVWSEFTDREVKRIDGTELTYYNTFLAGQTKTAQLLKDGDGGCDSWAKFFIDLRKIHGIDITNELIELRSAATLPYPKKGFLVKDWTFAGTGTSGDPSYPYVNIPDSPFRSPNTYNWKFAEVTDDAGTSGQGTSNPASLFLYHIVVLYDGEYFDPSYGKKYTSLLDIDNNAIEAYFRRGFAFLDEPTFNADLNGDGDKVDMGVYHVFYYFNKNPNGLDLVSSADNY